MAEFDPPPKPQQEPWRTSSSWLSPFMALCIVGFLGRLSYEMMRTPLTPLLARHLGAPEQFIGLIVAAVTITGIFVKLPTGALSDIFGFRRLMMTGVWVKISGPFLYLLAFSWPALLIVRFYHGLATAIYAPPASALVVKTYPEERGRRLGLYNGAENHRWSINKTGRRYGIRQIPGLPTLELAKGFWGFGALFLKSTRGFTRNFFKKTFPNPSINFMNPKNQKTKPPDLRYHSIGKLTPKCKKVGLPPFLPAKP